MTDILAIVGSVRFACPKGLLIARDLIAEELDERRPDAVVSGDADGTDTLAKNAALARDIRYIGHPPKRRRWAGPGGFMERNLRVAHDATRAMRIACVDSKTFGSGWTVARVEEMCKPVRRVFIDRDGNVTDSGWPS